MVERLSASPENRRITRVAIKFSEADKARGMDILLDFGSAQAFPGRVYICSQEQLDNASERLRSADVEFQVRHNIPSYLTMQQARSLSDSEGWEQLTDQKSNI